MDARASNEIEWCLDLSASKSLNKMTGIMSMQRVIIMTLAAAILLAGFPFNKASIDETPEEDCTTIVVGKNASATGSTIIAHNEDDSGSTEISLRIAGRNSFPESLNVTGGGRVYRENHTMLTLSVPEKSYAYAWSHMKDQDFSDSYINEKGVTIFSDACPSREDKPELEYGGIRHHLRKWVAEQAGSAAEAVRLMGALIESYGYGDSGRTYVIADPEETWVLHAVYGKRWVAQRVPDDSITVISNCYVINEINLRDTRNFLGSEDIMSYARERGWWSGEETFDFSRVYGRPEAQVSDSNIYRRWLGLYLLTGKDFDPRAMPFSAIPREKVTVERLMSTMRSHFEDTKHGAQSKEALEARGRFHRNFAYRPICVSTTQESSVVELRKNVPEELSVVWWRASCNPCLNVYVPWYPVAMIKDGSDFPGPYVSGEASRTFRTLTDLVDGDYKNRAGGVKSGWAPLERSFLSTQRSLEDACSELIRKGKTNEATTILTHYSCGAGMRALDIAKETTKAMES